MGGATYSGKGPHLAVRIKPDGYVTGSSRSRVDGHITRVCLYCHRSRSTDHTGTVWLGPGDKRILPRLGHSDKEQSAAVREVALGSEQTRSDRYDIIYSPKTMRVPMTPSETAPSGATDPKCARPHWVVICDDCATAEDATANYANGELLCSRCGKVGVRYIALPFEDYENLPRVPPASEEGT